MNTLHFLDVGQGDCSILMHGTGRVSVIDVCKARPVEHLNLLERFARDQRGEVPFSLASAVLRATNNTEITNPVSYLERLAVDRIHRFILSHPDMDHMDGIKIMFERFRPLNFWDTQNTKVFTPSFMYNDNDWKFYTALRGGRLHGSFNRLTLFDGSQGAFWNCLGPAGEPHDGFLVLAPTPELLAEGNRLEDWNDAGYVLLWFTPAGRVLFWGDAHNRTRQHVMGRYSELLREVELMIAPHHGRDSDSDREYLSSIRPKLTLFGCAPSEHLADDAWRNRGLKFISNKRAGNIIVDMNGDRPWVYVQHQQFAAAANRHTFRSGAHHAWCWGCV